MQMISTVARKHKINHMKANQLTPHSIGNFSYCLSKVRLPDAGYILKWKIRRKLTLKLKIREQ